MQTSSTMLMTLFGFAGFTTYAASQAKSSSAHLPAAQLPKPAMEKSEPQKPHSSLPDWVVMSGDMGLMFYRAVCSPRATRH